MMETISAVTAAEWLSGDEELAFLDVREAGPFSEGHPLFAVPLPWSGFEIDIGRLVPRKDVPVFLIDGGDGISGLAARALKRRGYSKVFVVEGGTPAWKAAGLTLFKGVHVPSKTLGELAEEIFHPKAISPEELSRWQTEGRDFLFYDCRPASEHRAMTVPGAACLPNGELPHRIDALPGDVPIVLTCAGRTRGIVGVATMGLVAPDRPVFWLEDGTQGWTLAGFDLSYDNPPSALPPLDADTAHRVGIRAKDFMTSYGIALISAAEARSLGKDDSRATYFFDVRSKKETREDLMPGFQHAPVVSLIQGTDRFLAVRHARVVLADDFGLRGAIAAFWLRALGFDVAVTLTGDDQTTAAERPGTPDAIHKAARIDANTALQQVAAGQARFVDVRSSADYSAGHVDGSTWSIRPRLGALTEEPNRVLLIGDETERADLAASTLSELGRDVRIVEGGLPALEPAGARISRRPPMNLADAIDVTSFALGRHQGNHDASRLYLAWEKGLVAQLGEAERNAFRI